MNYIAKKRTIFLIIIIIFMIFLYDYHVLSMPLLKWDSVYILEGETYSVNLAFRFWHFILIGSIIGVIMFLRKKKKNV